MLAWNPFSQQRHSQGAIKYYKTLARSCHRVHTFAVRMPKSNTSVKMNNKQTTLTTKTY